jgi:asparagine synthase (glutamine-hydrolysing)
MCGIFGMICGKDAFSKSRVESALTLMSHRGPDSWGLERHEIGENWELWLGHRRLSILDLSELGHQPMQRVGSSLVFNGEIYNHQDLRRRIGSKWTFRSKTDTEVLMAGLTLEGPSFLKETNGMMAFGFFDHASKTLTLGRDRLGKKPLYYHHSEKFLIFASELKTLKALGVDDEVDQEALYLYRWLGYIPASYSIFKSVHKLEAATTLSFRLQPDAIVSGSKVLFWDPLQSFGKRYDKPYADAKEDFIALLDDAVAIRVQADVPVGLFLSGGIDSSLVLTSLAHQKLYNVRAFSVQFEKSDFDESAVAVDTANRCNFPIEILRLDAKNLARQVDRIAYHFDEPFSDSSQIPTLAIAELARHKVTVVLTGDGGDESFLGYSRYAQQNKLKQILPYFPIVRPALRWLATSPLAPALVSRLAKGSGQGDFAVNLAQKVERFKSILEIRNRSQIYETLVAVQQRKNLLMPGMTSPLSLVDQVKEWYPQYSWDALKGRSFVEQMSAIDLILYLRDDVLVKVDRATMANSIEARAPLLDYRIVEFGTALPLEYKMFQGTHKRILRDALAMRIAGPLSSLKKRGFGVPLPIAQEGKDTPLAIWNRKIEEQWKASFRIA